MKKVLSFSLLSLMLFILSGCGSNEGTIISEEAIAPTGDEQLIQIMNTNIINAIKKELKLREDDVAIMTDFIISEDNLNEYTYLFISLGLSKKVDEKLAIDIAHDTINQLFEENNIINYEDILTIQIEFYKN